MHEEMESLILVNESIESDRDIEAAAVQISLKKFRGKAFETFKENKKLARLIHVTAQRVERLFACTRCGRPAGFRCANPKGTAAGNFQFVHANNSTHGVGSAVPLLKLVRGVPKKRRIKKERREITERDSNEATDEPVMSSNLTQ